MTAVRSDHLEIQRRGKTGQFLARIKETDTNDKRHEQNLSGHMRASLRRRSFKKGNYSGTLNGTAKSVTRAVELIDNCTR